MTAFRPDRSWNAYEMSFVMGDFGVTDHGCKETDFRCVAASVEALQTQVWTSS